MKTKLFVLFFALIFALCGCQTVENAPAGSLPELTVTFLSVGAADCIVLQTGGQAAMIDAGHNGDGEDILAFLDKQGIEKLDFLLLTHLDKDHIGGADIVMENIPIGTVYAPDYDKGNKQYEQYIEALDRLNIEPVHPTEAIELTLGEAKITLLPGERAEYEQSNDYSIMAELVYGENTFLFAGDAEAERLGEYLTGEPMQEVDVLKVPHHGRESALSAEFFAYVQPKHAVITCEEKEMPDDAVVNFLNSLDAEVYGTVYGTVTVTTDGVNTVITQ